MIRLLSASLTLGLLVAVFAVPCAADDKKDVEKPVKFNFPDVKGWKRGEIRPYPEKAAGYSVAYNSDDGITVTVYVYDRGLKEIPNDLTSAVVKEQFKGAKDAIYEAMKLKYYESVKELKSDEGTLGKKDRAPKTLTASFELGTKQGLVLSDIHVTVYENHFIKLRCTRPKDSAEKTQKSLDTLLDEMGVLFANK